MYSNIHHIYSTPTSHHYSSVEKLKMKNSTTNHTNGKIVQLRRKSSVPISSSKTNEAPDVASLEMLYANASISVKLNAIFHFLLYFFSLYHHIHILNPFYVGPVTNDRCFSVSFTSSIMYSFWLHLEKSFGKFLTLKDIFGVTSFDLNAQHDKLLSFFFFAIQSGIFFSLFYFCVSSFIFWYFFCA